jgi:hypothetical protein
MHGNRAVRGVPLMTEYDRTLTTPRRCARPFFCEGPGVEETKGSTGQSRSHNARRRFPCGSQRKPRPNSPVF